MAYHSTRCSGGTLIECLPLGQGPKPFYIRVAQYSPLAFNGKDVENDFFYVHLATQCAATYKSMKLLGFYIALVCCRLVTATTREGLYTLGWGLAVAGLCLFGVVLRNSHPLTFAKYSQVHLPSCTGFR
jgi:hypothetical protein